MSVLEVDLSLLFVLAVILIWFMIGYQFALTVFGYFNFMRSFRQKKALDTCTFDFPTCTIMIPAHNEAKVIGATVRSILGLVYPADRLKILVINDGSTDETASIVEGIAMQDRRLELFTIPPGDGAKGKSRALNLALRNVASDVIDRKSVV